MMGLVANKLLGGVTGPRARVQASPLGGGYRPRRYVSISRSGGTCGRRGTMPSVIVVALVAVSIAACHRNESKPTIAPKPPLEASASVDRAVATTGDVITYTVRVEHEAALEVSIPELGAEIVGLRLVDSGDSPSRKDKGRVARERWYKLRADLVGTYVLPAAKITARAPGTAEPKTAETSQIFIEVKSVLPEGAEAGDLRDIKPLMPLRYGLPWYAWVAIAGAAVAAAGALVWLLRRRRQELVVPATPPHELAFAALDSLRRSDFSDPAAVRRFFFLVSEVLRSYIEGRFGLNATDLTSEEILPRLRDLGELSPAQKGSLREFFDATDTVKFAGREAQEQDIEKTYEQALGFVEATAQRPQGTAVAASE